MPGTNWTYVPLYQGVLMAGILSGCLGTMVKWDMSESSWDSREEGGNITLRCVVRHLSSAFSAVSVERTAGGSTVLVSTNQRVEDAFRAEMHAGWRRYSARFEMMIEIMGYIATLHLTIRALRSEDAGLMRCKSEGEQTPLKTLAVRVPVEDVYMRRFYPNDTSVRVPNTTTITMAENQRSGVSCSVVMRTSLIPPEVRITSDGRNVTDLFSYQTPVEVEGTLRPMYMWEYRMYTQRPNIELHDQQLDCEAFSVGHETQVMRASVEMQVEFRPRIMCMKYEYWGYVGGSTTLTCAVKSNPKAQITFRFGYFLTDNEYKISKPLMVDGQYVFTRQEMTGGVSNMTITLHNLRKAHFDYKYKMDAINKYGSAAVTLELYESSIAGAASHVTSCTLGALLLVSCLVTWCTTYLQR